MPKFILSAFADEAGKPLAAQINALQRNKIGYMEIRTVDGKNVSDLTNGEAKDVRAALDAADIRVKTVGSAIGKINITDDLAPHIDKLKHTLEIANILGAERLRMFSFFLPAGSAETYRDDVMERMDRMLDAAKGSGVTFYHENEKGIYGDTLARVRDLIDTFGERMRFIFDPANFLQCGERPAEIYPALAKDIAYFHIKDAVFETGTVVPAGEGDGGIPDILAAHAATADGTMLTVEPHLKIFSGFGDMRGMNEAETARFKDNDTAFDTAVTSLKNILEREGLSYE